MTVLKWGNRAAGGFADLPHFLHEAGKPSILPALQQETKMKNLRTQRQI